MPAAGEVPERLNGPVSKMGVASCVTAGSNPALSVGAIGQIAPAALSGSRQYALSRFCNHIQQHVEIGLCRAEVDDAGA